VGSVSSNQPLNLDVTDLSAVQESARDEGFAFIDRLAEDWLSGANKFDQTGEVLLGAFAESTLVGVGGINIDPYLDALDVCRLRHLYVLPNYRRTGLASGIVSGLVSGAAEKFRLIRLRTDTVAGAAFYERNGFMPVSDQTASHQLVIEKMG
jgi:GNAT superfamily N-acetyltransferase